MATCEFQKEIDAIILGEDARQLVATAQEIAKKMIQHDKWGNVSDRNSVSTSQIRNIFGTSKQIEMNLSQDNIDQSYNRLILLKPKMAYANARFNKRGDTIPGFKVLIDSLSYAIDKVDGNYERMQSFFNFLEAILAYHKAEGGK